MRAITLNVFDMHSRVLRARRQLVREASATSDRFDLTQQYLFAIRTNTWTTCYMSAATGDAIYGPAAASKETLWYSPTVTAYDTGRAWTMLDF